MIFFYWWWICAGYSCRGSGCADLYDFLDFGRSLIDAVVSSVIEPGHCLFSWLAFELAGGHMGPPLQLFLSPDSRGVRYGFGACGYD